MSFDTAVEMVFKHEGGYVNHPDDPGGETKFGISKRAYPEVDIANLTKEEAGQIYKRDYWDRIHGDSLPFAVAVLAFDYAVNSGVSRSAKALQTVVGAVPDGVVGPNTLASVTEYCEEHGVVDLCRKFTFQRQQHVRSLLTYKTFGRGWERRITETHDTALEYI